LSTSFTSSDSHEQSERADITNREPSGFPHPWWKDLVTAYKVLDSSSLPSGVMFGVSFETFTIDPPIYTAHLLNKIEKLGGRSFRACLPTNKGIKGAVEEATKMINENPETDAPVWAVVNATGLRAKEMLQDANLYPIRGQTVRVKGVANRVTTRLGAVKEDVAAIMPRPYSGITVIGVTIEPNIWETTIDEDKIPELLERAKVLAPELTNESGEFDIVKVGVGLRPGRKGGARVELDCSNGFPVVHAYGVAGAGYQNSVGCARKVLKLLREHQT
jgi:D-amino-acid oxidase